MYHNAIDRLVLAPCDFAAHPWCSATAAAAAAPPASSVQQPRMFSLQSAPMTNGKVNRFLANSHAVAK